ncbi:hypothetical protein LIP_0935 [Limnochorda pilosa]|uniref:Methyltransferase type 11 domain-containing protein n=1 Tax=Limnochorda pilosa TaxID=1555112 RepID=A0A0K2SIE7_LIMPI|nr:hypothetical protein LIP_0935 [Limnochorda pilosa]
MPPRRAGTRPPLARRRHGRSGTFLRGDACRLETVKGPRAAHADAVVFLLSLQDMDPLEAALDSAAWALKPEGRIVRLMTHPCFRVARQSGWAWDANRELQFRRVDRYLTPLAVPVRPLPGGKPGAIHSFHRPLQAYCNELARLGFLIDRLIEMPTTRQALGRRRGHDSATGGNPEFVTREGHVHAWEWHRLRYRLRQRRSEHP